MKNNDSSNTNVEDQSTQKPSLDNLEQQILAIEHEIKELNDVFNDHNERFTPQALAMIEARVQRTSPLKSILQNRELPGGSWIYLMKPIETYIAEIENIYKPQALFPTKENLEKIKASCNILSAVHDKLKVIPAEALDETSLTMV